MLLFVVAKVKEILKKGRDYPWPKPNLCPRCKASSVWGHGFVEAYFDGFNDAVLLRRYRCPGCGCVIRLRPCDYFGRFQARIETIRSSLSHRLQTGRWPPGLSHTRQGHWLRALRKRVTAYLGNTWSHGLLKAFDYFVARGQVPVSRSI